MTRWRDLVDARKGSILFISALGLLAPLLWPRPLQARNTAVAVIDLHVDISYRSLFQGAQFSRGSGEFTADSLIASGVRGVVLPLFVPEDAAPQGRTRAQLERSYNHVFRSILSTKPYSLPGCGVSSAGGKRRALSTWLAFEGSAPIGASDYQIRKWVLRGVRSFGLVHSIDNEFSTSSGRSWKRRKTSTGLSTAGRKFMKQVFSMGALIDVSHASDLATNEAIDLALSSRKPVIATHSNARALAPHPRNLTDEQIRGIAQSGGVIGVNFHQAFLARRRWQAAGLHDVVKQMLYLRKLGGIKVVALGSDFEGGITPVPELKDASRYQRLAQELRKSGWSSAEVQLAFSGNARRVLCPHKN